MRYLRSYSISLMISSPRRRITQSRTSSRTSTAASGCGAGEGLQEGAGRRGCCAWTRSSSWSVPGSKGLVNVSGDTSVIGGFEKRSEEGLCALADITAAKKKVHVGLAMEIETLKISAARAVYADGSRARGQVRAVRSGCVGKGRRDNYRRFSCGRTGALARPLWNQFIIGSEQIYAYEIAERTTSVQISARMKTMKRATSTLRRCLDFGRREPPARLSSSA